jgi:hypothetical protein
MSTCIIYFWKKLESLAYNAFRYLKPNNLVLIVFRRIYLHESASAIVFSLPYLYLIT